MELAVLFVHDELCVQAAGEVFCDGQTFLLGRYSAISAVCVRAQYYPVHFYTVVFKRNFNRRRCVAVIVVIFVVVIVVVLGFSRACGFFSRARRARFGCPCGFRFELVYVVLQFLIGTVEIAYCFKQFVVIDFTFRRFFKLCDTRVFLAQFVVELGYLLRRAIVKRRLCGLIFAFQFGAYSRFEFGAEFVAQFRFVNGLGVARLRYQLFDFLFVFAVL